jgi:hypothetical protein
VPAPEPIVAPEPLPQRHGCFMIVLIICAVFSLVGVIWAARPGFAATPSGFPLHPELDKISDRGVSAGALQFYRGLQLAYLASFVGLWFFRRWAFYLCCLAVAAEFAFFLSIGEVWTRAAIVFPFLALIYFILKIGDEDEEAWRHLR